MTVKNLVFLIIVLFWIVGCQDKDKSVNPNKNSIIILKVQVLDNLDSAKKNLPKWTEAVTQYIFRFKVLEVINGSYDKTEIKIKILAPFEAINSKHLENNKTYTYKLVPGSYTNSEMKVIQTDYYERLEHTR